MTRLALHEEAPTRILACVTFALAACGKSPARGPIQVTDSGPVRTVHIADLARAPFPTWSTRLVATTESNDSLTFSPTVRAAFTADSNLWIAAASEAIVLGPDGQVRRKVGRRGAGPGEFGLIFHLGITATNSVMMSEFGSGRMAEFRATGALVRTVARIGGDVGPDVDPITQLADGRILATLWQQRPNRLTNPALPAGTTFRDSAPLLVLDSTGTRIGQLGVWRGRERARVDLSGEPAGLPLPFGRNAVYDGRGEFTVIGSTDSLDLSLFQGSTLVLRLLGPLRSEQPSAEQTADWEQAVPAEDSATGAAYLGAIAGAPRVAALPAIGAVVVDDAGNLWIGRYVVRPGAPRTWYVISRRGEPLGRVELPAASPVLMPGSVELLDVAGGRLAVRRNTAGGEVVVDVREVVRP